MSRPSFYFPFDPDANDLYFAAVGVVAAFVGTLILGPLWTLAAGYLYVLARSAYDHFMDSPTADLRQFAWMAAGVTVVALPAIFR